MSNLSDLFAQNIVLVYFLYGLAFFSMGLAVWLESGRASELRLARAMGPLALFGILHGVHEWLEMFMRLGEVVPGAPTVGQTMVVEALRIALLMLSFLLLIVFGVRLLHLSGHGRGNERTFVILSAGLLVLVWFVSVMSTQQVYAFCEADCLVSVDVLTRYILGIPGAILAGWAMLLEQRAFRERGLVLFARDLTLAAIALLLYGVVGQLFVPRSVLFPADVINSELFVELFGVPVQFFRALMAAAMALFVIRALRAFELEHRQRLVAMHAAQRAAEEEKRRAQQRAHEQTEQLNRELQTAVQELSLLFELTRSLVATLDSETLLQDTLQRIVGSIPHVAAGMILGEEGTGAPLAVVIQLGCESKPGMNSLCQQMEQVGAYVVRQRMPARYDSDAGAAVGIVEDEPAASRIIGVPLHLHDVTWGSLILGVEGDTPLFTAHDLSLVGTVAGQLSMAVENATLYEETQQREALRSELYQQIISAQEGERQRIARELHDGTGQVLTGLGLGLKAAAESVWRDPELAARQLIELKDLNALALQELRDLIADLRPSILDDLGLVPALQAQVKAFAARTGLQAVFESRGPRRRLSPEEETVIFRITQEALTNVAKHAQAQHVMVRLTFTGNATHLVVTDDGRGFNPNEALQVAGSRRAWGLLGMQERVQLVQGACEIASKPGIGTTVRVLVPHHDEEEKDEPQTTPAAG